METHKTYATLLALTVASILYVVGGIAMKHSKAFEVLTPSILVFVFFGLAAGIQTWAMNQTELGKGYVFVLGLESVFSILAGIVLFDETMTFFKVAGMTLIVAGIILMKAFS